MAFNDFVFFDAKMENFPFSLFSARNSAIADLAGYTIGLSPYVNNKITLAEYINYKSSAPANYAGSAFATADPQYSLNTSINNYPLIGGLVGGSKYTSDFFSLIVPYIPKNPVFYYEYKTVADIYGSCFNENYVFVNTLPFCGVSPNTLKPPQFDTQRRGNMGYVTPLNKIPSIGENPSLAERITDLGALGDRIVITKFQLYDGEQLPRDETRRYISPTIFLTGASNFEWASSSASAKKIYHNDIKIAFPFSPVMPLNGITAGFNFATNTEQASASMALLSETISGTTVNDPNLNQFYIASRLPGINGIKIVSGVKRNFVFNDGNIKPQVYLPLTGTITPVNYPLFFTPSTFDNAVPPMLTFDDTNVFEKICGDLGLTVTNNIDDAKNMPIDFFPDAGGGTVPGGDVPPSGFPTNPIPNIPSFPDNTTDTIPETPPNISALSSAGVYALDLPNTKSFLKWLMSDDFVQNISNLFNDKLSAVGDLKLFPFDIALHDSAHAVASDTLTVGNVTGAVSNHRIIDGYNTWISGGEYKYTAYYGDANDFEHCSYSLYIPYAGIVELDAGDVVNKTLRLSYAVDILTGAATAVVYSDDVIVKMVNANMGVSIPITSTNNNQRQLNSTLAQLGIGNSILNGGISSALSGSPMPLFNSVINGAFSGINSMMTNPLKTQHSGTFGVGSGLSLSQSAFLIITRQVIAIPTDYKSVMGAPATYRGKISEFVGSGFVSVSVSKIDISNNATQSERDQILSALSRGIYI